MYILSLSNLFSDQLDFYISKYYIQRRCQNLAEHFNIHLAPHHLNTTITLKIYYSLDCIRKPRGRWY